MLSNCRVLRVPGEQEDFIEVKGKRADTLSTLESNSSPGEVE